MPDDAALALMHMLLRGLDAEILMHARQLFPAAVEQHKVVHQLNQPRLVAHLKQVLVDLEATVVLFILFPREEILLFGANGAVLQAFGIVAGEDDLHRGEKPLVELLLLIGEELADAVADGGMAVLQLDLSDAPVLMFRNAGSGALNVVYRRGDGNVGWIDPERATVSKGN